MTLRTLARKAKKETIGVEAFSSLDGQGAPSYAASEDIEAFVIEDQTQTETSGFVVDADGSDVRVTLTLWVPADESPIPDERDRLTRGGDTFIVTAAREAKNLRGTTDHYKVEARDE